MQHQARALTRSIDHADVKARANKARSGGRLFGYVREDGGAATWSPERRHLEHAGCDVVFHDTCAGAAVLRPALAQALEQLQAGDALQVRSLAQLTWRRDEVLNLIGQLLDRGVHLIATAEALDTRKSMSTRDTVQALLRYEASVHRERRTPARTGRPAAISADAWADMKPKLDRKEITPRAAATTLSVSLATVYRRLSGA